MCATIIDLKSASWLDYYRAEVFWPACCDKRTETAIIGSGNYYPVEYLTVELLYRVITTMESGIQQ